MSLSFHIIHHKDIDTHVLEYKSGGCRPATRCEAAMWEQLKAAEARAEKAEAKLKRAHEWLADNEAVHQLDIGLDALSDILND